MESEYVQTHCVLADGGDQFGVCSLAFDKHEELLWMGNQGGHVTSYYSGGLQKYTSFQVHGSEDIRQILSVDDGVLILSPGMLRFQIRRGLPIFTHRSSNLQEMQCMLQLSPSRLLMGGHQDKLIDFNISHCKETTLIDVRQSGCALLRSHSRFVCTGDPVGLIDLRDPTTLKVEHTLETHSGSLSDFDVQGNLLVTCGFSNRQGGLAVDRFLMVYDLRMLRAVSPIQTVLDPLYLRFLPSISSRLAVVSPLGQVQLVDTVALSETRLCLLQMENPGAMCLAFDVSATSQAMALGDNTGSIHLFSATSDPLFNSYSRLTEQADHVTPFQSLAVDDYSVPLSAIPLPLLNPEISFASDWPEHLIQKTYRKTPPIDAEILKTMKVKGPIGYAPNPKATRRNQVIYNLETINSKTHKKYLQDRNCSKHPFDENTFIAIPKRYRRFDMKFSKLGTDDFQFEQFNRTGFSGLEATLPNSYCNCMIQVLYHIEPLRVLLLSHLCTKEFCLSCELGFLFHMMSTSQGQPCQPGNFLRAFRTVPQASALGLIVSDLNPEAKAKVDLAGLIQSWNTFILHQMHSALLETKKKSEGKSMGCSSEADFGDSKIGELHSSLDERENPEESDISSLFGFKQLQIHCCLKCGKEVKKESMLLNCTLAYPTGDLEKDSWSFCDILTGSLCPQQMTRAWCEQCNKYTPNSQTGKLQSLPKILSINTALQNSQNKLFWQTQMEKMVSKASIVESTVATNMSTILSSKPCRYGDNCSRPGCRFRHSFDPDKQKPQCHVSCSNNWLPHSIQMTLANDKLVIEKRNVKKSANEQHDAVSSKETNSASTTEEGSRSSETLGGKMVSNNYNLSAVVCFIKDHSFSEKRNLIALIRLPNRTKQPLYGGGYGDDEHLWYLFNDFTICTVPAQETVWFSLDWKIPCVLFYSSENMTLEKKELLPVITKEVFAQDESIGKSSGCKGVTFTPLSEKEMPKPGELVAMDAEFVTLDQEEAELRSDGKMSTVKPSQMSVARITCVRGQGPLEGVPFIDDYISTQEQVADYLTKFSGIKPGDLDANFSSKHLTTLKSTYTKLRFLQDSGAVFVGHGLKNDFRVINLVVPPEQIFDTVLLYHLPHHRMVSLRFLAWHFLGVKIQSETHDSIEDARAALHLYRKYKELVVEGKFVDALTNLYETGKALNWRVPDD
ncbi:PAN2-PAN3 deadenylation complex catalytic subunit PAN2 isoform X2 [Agrilus planipennis]|uniref:PAN2-PAN3 deadenylation complex catalytic subunit PAN2 n=1 Tax=Agrilus planipennis TaxID=224129 RepID=A0A1W4WJ71_AGRPL|nr:PAN2-PAN3 deadenylation complex catalytic subunit PAN2 isoform X2 [Agrilus planipennis]